MFLLPYTTSATIQPEKITLCITKLKQWLIMLRCVTNPAVQLCHTISKMAPAENKGTSLECVVSEKLIFATWLVEFLTDLPGWHF